MALKLRSISEVLGCQRPVNRNAKFGGSQKQLQDDSNLGLGEIEVGSKWSSGRQLRGCVYAVRNESCCVHDQTGDGQDRGNVPRSLA